MFLLRPRSKRTGNSPESVLDPMMPTAAPEAGSAVPVGATAEGEAGAIEAPTEAPTEALDAELEIERRSTPRRGVPLGPAFRAAFTWMGKPRDFILDDLSLGGVGMRAPLEFGRGIHPGQTLQQVRLTLDVHGSLVVDLHVRSRRGFRSFLAGEQAYLGCQFGALGTREQEELQRVLALLDPARYGQRGSEAG